MSALALRQACVRNVRFVVVHFLHALIIIIWLIVFVVDLKGMSDDR